MTDSDSFFVCIPAGGLGLRMNSPIPKQYLEIAGKPILAHTMALFNRMPECAKIVIAASDVHEAEGIIERFPVETPVTVVQGGETRQESVSNALTACEDDNRIVLIHDAVRPCITEAQVLRVRDAVALHGAAMLAVPAHDTIKRVEHGHIVETLNREQIWLAQTPQGAPLALWRRAFAEALSDGYTGTDDASLLEHIGLKVAVVEGSPENIKVTTPEDIAVAEMFLSQKQGGD